MIENRYQVVCVAGGMGKGLRHRTKDEIPKCLLTVVDKPLLEYTLELYVDNGFDDFVLLLGHLYQKIINYVENSKYKGLVRYSIEKDLYGKGGAVKAALNNGVIDRKKPSILCYPDDLILKKDFPKALTSYHEDRLKEGIIATMVSTRGSYYRYGVPTIDERGFVTAFKEKPWVDIPANVGVYVLEPEVYKIIDDAVDLNKRPVDFEKVVLPKLCEKRALANFFIDYEAWTPFNDEKDFEVGIEKVRRWLSLEKH